MKKIYLLLITILLMSKIGKAQLIINEVLYDPANTVTDGDANGDGVRSASQDEFIELYNNSTVAINLSGYKIFDGLGLRNNVPRHIFPNGTIIQPKKALVVFGGGTPTGTFGGANIQTATTSDLNLTNDGDTITVRDSSNNFILSLDIEPWSNNPDESYTRSPDVTGSFVQHSTIVGNTRKFSPGTDLNGLAFVFTLNRIVTFKVDMNKYNLSYTKVNIAGSFNNWCNSCNPMQDNDQDGLWEVTLQLTKDTFDYKFVLDTITRENFSTVSSCTKLIGSDINRYSIISSDSIFKSVCFETCSQCAGGLSLKGITDFKTSVGGISGKSIHLVADSNISNLSIYGIGVANNGGGSNGQEYRFPSIPVLKGSNILLVRDTANIASYFNECWSMFNIILLDTTGTVSQNGNDAVELFKVKEVVETFGDVNVNGTGKPWEYTGSWAFKNNAGLWTYGALNCTDSSENIYKSKCVYPICTELKVKSISVTGENNINIISQNGGTLKMNARILPLNAKDTTVKWSVTNPGVATIDSNGVLKALVNGNSIVMATANDGSGVFGTRIVNITGQITPAIMLTSVSISSQNNATTISQLNGTLNFFTNVFPKNASDTSVNWSVDNNTIATISSNGVLTAKANGIVKVKATANDGSLKADSMKITITGQIIQLTSVKIFTQGNILVISEADETLNFFTNVLPKNATDTSVNWSVDNNTIATISNAGVLTAKANGIVKVKAIANDGSGKADSANVVITNQTNIKEINKSKIRIYPIPTNNIIYIESQMEINEFKISNLLGQIVENGYLESNQKDLQHFANGVYFLELKINDSWAKFKIIKN